MKIPGEPSGIPGTIDPGNEAEAANRGRDPALSQTIDAHRWYSNWGPLAMRLEEQLARRLNVGSESVVTTGSGTGA